MQDLPKETEGKEEKAAMVVRKVQ